MKTKISELISQKLHLTDPSGNILGEVFMETGGLIKLKVGAETNDFIINRPFNILVDPIVNHEITFDISKNKSYLVKLETASVGETVLKLTLNPEIGKVSRGEIIIKINATINYLIYNIPAAHYVNRLEGYPVGYYVDIISYLYDGEQLFVNIGNSYKDYVF